MFNVLLQVLDDGRLTDGQGRTVDFKNTIVIMTSNIGSHRILEYRGSFEGDEYDGMKRPCSTSCANISVRNSSTAWTKSSCSTLSEKHLKQIVEIQLQRLRRRLAERRVTIELSEAAKRHIVKVGYDPTYGARPLKRTIQKELETPLGRKILAGDINDGDTVDVGFDDVRGELTFKVASKEAVTA